MEEANANKLISQVSRILYDEWDPIGVSSYGGPEDEYLKYAKEVVRLMQSDHDKSAIKDYLLSSAERKIGLR